MPVERTSETWIAVRKHVETELAQAREELERPAPLDVTNLVRGRILALKSVLALGEDRRTIDETPRLY